MAAQSEFALKMLLCLWVATVWLYKVSPQNTTSKASTCTLTSTHEISTAHKKWSFNKIGVHKLAICHEGKAELTPRYSMNVANPSLSQSPSHHSIVTRSPNHYREDMKKLSKLDVLPISLPGGPAHGQSQQPLFVSQQRHLFCYYREVPPLDMWSVPSSPSLQLRSPGWQIDLCCVCAVCVACVCVCVCVCVFMWFVWCVFVCVCVYVVYVVCVVCVCVCVVCVCQCAWFHICSGSYKCGHNTASIKPTQ